jgi:hypothetical protein
MGRPSLRRYIPPVRAFLGRAHQHIHSRPLQRPAEAAGQGVSSPSGALPACLSDHGISRLFGLGDRPSPPSTAALIDGEKGRRRRRRTTGGPPLPVTSPSDGHVKRAARPPHDTSFSAGASQRAGRRPPRLPLGVWRRRRGEKRPPRPRAGRRAASAAAGTATWVAARPLAGAPPLRVLACREKGSGLIRIQKVNAGD